MTSIKLPGRGVPVPGSLARPAPAPATTWVERPRQWTIEIPAAYEWVTANARMHHMAMARLVARWRDTAYYAALSVRPARRLDLVRVDVLFRFAGRKPVREIENLRPTLKVCVDGTIGPSKGDAPGYGIVPDDSDEHLVYGSYDFEMVPGKRYGPRGWVVLTVTDLSDGAPC